MLKRELDYSKSYRYVCYARMSSDSQNKRSPDQQFDTINGILKRAGYSWVLVRTYRDDGISGRLVRERPGFSEMLASIRNGTLRIDLILVDTLERFGRMDNLDEVRRELLDKYGVAVLTADNNFADPLTATGQIVGKIEQIRATEDSRVKAHNVLRGKKDTALQRKWPGSTAPFGKKLRTILPAEGSGIKKPYSLLDDDPETCWIIKLTFETAGSQGLGANRLARFLNEHPSIPDKLKPFTAATVGRWLQNRIYIGELVFGKTHTGIASDTRVVRRNEEADITRVPDFCEPLVEKNLFDLVQTMRLARTRQRRRKDSNEKLLLPVTPGMALTFPLTGLVRCGHCQRSMRPTSNQYKSVGGTTIEYRRYTCPGHLDATCTNSLYIDERWLVERVAETIRTRLLGF